MYIVVFGASGHVGKLVTTELLQRGHTVTAFVHRRPVEDGRNLKTVKGSVHSAHDVAKALQGQDAIISALSSWKSKDKNVLASAMETIIPEAERLGTRRLVSLTGNVAAAPGDIQTTVSKLSRKVFSLIAPGVLHDGEAHIAMLDASSLEWTVIRSPIMTGGSGVAYGLDSKTSSLYIPRRAVAACMVDVAENGSYIRTAPFIKNHVR